MYQYVMKNGIIGFERGETVRNDVSSCLSICYEKYMLFLYTMAFLLVGGETRTRNEMREWLSPCS